MANLVHVRGLAELNKFLEELPQKLERNILRGALRAGMAPIRKAAAGNIHSVSGLLAKGLKVSTRARDGRIVASLRATGPHAHVAPWLEYGVGAHVIQARIGSALSFGGGRVRRVNHPGTKARAFLRPALDSQAQAALMAAGEYIKRRLTKQGLDVADVALDE